MAAVYLISLLTRVATACLGSIGIYALICSSLHAHPDAALAAIMLLGAATTLHFAGEKT